MTEDVRSIAADDLYRMASVTVATKPFNLDDRTGSSLTSSTADFATAADLLATPVIDRR